MPTTFPAIFLSLLTCVGFAQEPLPYLMADHLYFGPPQYECPKDSADFMRFRRGLKTVDPTFPKDTTTIHYRMVWKESQHGGLWTVSRGDGNDKRPTAHGSPELGDEMNLHFLTSDGRRGYMIMNDIPCGMICRDAWYYVEE